jgi:serine/threonine protein kinase
VGLADDLDVVDTQRFAIRRRLGAGAMGVVYEAFDKELGARVALKTLHEIDPRALYRLKREFRSLQGIQHPNLVGLGDLVEHAGHWFFTMELVEGVDFLRHVRPGGDGGDGAPPSSISIDDTVRGTIEAAPPPSPRRRLGPAFDEERLRGAMLQLGLGLSALHAAGKVHRDVKPSNIMVTDTGRVVLLDFGLVAQAASPDDLSTENKVAGTIAYMAPELALTGQLGPEADWYSFGVLLYEALTARLPHDGRTSLEVLMNKQKEAPRPPSQLAPTVPPDLERLCLDLLRGEPGERPIARDILMRLGADLTLPGVPSAKSASRPTPSQLFVGRDRELEALRAAYDASVGGEARSVLVRGESGIGKSALVRHFTDTVTADRPDVVVLAGRCYERESVPYKAFDGVVDALTRHLRRLPADEASELVPRHAALLPRVFPILGGVEAIARAPRPHVDIKDPHELRRRVFAAMRELLMRLAERHPVVIVIDDLQWADADSRLLLEDVLRPPDAPPLLVLASVRTDAGPAPGSDGDGEPLLPGDPLVVELPPLAAADARELARRLLRSADGATASAAAIATEAHGHPLYIDELVRHAAAGDGGARPLRLDDAIRARVAQLGDDARAVLELIAIADAPLPRQVLADATGMELPAVTKLLGALQLANLVRTAGRRGTERVEPYHDRVRESVQAGLGADARQSLHAVLALVLPTAPGIAPELALRHLEAAGETAAAAAYAERAAMHASGALAFDRAVELYRSALRLGGHDGERERALRIQLGDALVNAGRGAEAADAFLAAVPGADAATRLDCQRKAAEQLLVCGHLERGLAAIRDVLAEIGDSLPDTPRRALASAVWNHAKLVVRGRRWRERDPSEISAAALTRLEVYRAVAFGLGVVDAVRGMDFIARGARLALRTGEPRRIVLCVAYLACSLASRGAHGSARRWSALARRIAERLGDPYLLAWVDMSTGAIGYFSGDFDVGARFFGAAEDTFRERTSGTTFEINNARLFRLFSLRHAGALSELRTRRDDYLRDAARRGDRYAETSMRRSGNLAWLVADDPAQAAADLESTGWIPPEGVFHVQHWYELEARAELALYVGGVREQRAELAAAFERLDRSMLGRVELVRIVSTWLGARLALAEGGADGLRGARRAARRLRRWSSRGTGFAGVFAGLVDAALAVADGQELRAEAILRRTLDRAEALHMALHAAAARHRLGELLGPRAGAEHVALAAAWMKAESVIRPERLLEVIAPVARAPRRLGA